MQPREHLAEPVVEPVEPVRRHAGERLADELVLLSNAFVDPDAMPGALAALVDANPVSHLVTAVRGSPPATGRPRRWRWSPRPRR